MLKVKWIQKLSALALLPLLLLGSSAWAWPPTYGAEFEIGSKAMLTAPEFDNYRASQSLEKKEQMKYIEHLRARCVALGCIVSEVTGKWDKDFRVEFTDGWFFKVSYDPGCVEITFKPSTLETLRQKVTLINDAIFKTAQEVGMKSLANNSNHFNMGIRSAFDDSGENFLKYFVDYANHPDLALGSLGDDTSNAPPLSILGEDQRQALQDIIQEFKDGKLVGIQQLAAAIQKRVYVRSYDPAWGGAQHYQAFGLKYVNRTDLTKKDAPLELRSMWGQPDAETFNKIAELMEARINFLNKSKAPIVYTASTRDEFTPKELKTRYFIYVEETGLKYEDYKALVSASVRRSALSPLVDGSASFQSRLKAIDDYWDLLAISPYLQKIVAQILANPAAEKSVLAKTIEKRLKTLPDLLTEATPIIVPVMSCDKVF